VSDQPALYEIFPGAESMPWLTSDYDIIAADGDDHGWQRVEVLWCPGVDASSGMWEARGAALRIRWRCRASLDRVRPLDPDGRSPRAFRQA
jgi:hypothetical protein